MPIFPDEKSIISANTEFAADVYKEISKIEKSNFLVSPFSLGSTLAFVQSGARGQTAEELRTSLHLPEDQKRIEIGFGIILPKLRSKDHCYSLHCANKLYIAKNSSVKDDFLQTGHVFGTDVETVKFSKNLEAAQSMNQWVKEKTDNKIQNLIDPSILSQDSAAVLINAAYFKGNWAYGFNVVRKKDFHQGDGKVVQTEAIHLFRDGDYLKYFESVDLNAKFLELFFLDDDVSMVFVLPNDKTGLSKLEAQIDKVFQTQNFTEADVDVILPKFKIETKTDFKKILENLGINKAFAPETDFGKISDDSLFLSNVIQKTFINLNENGVEAAFSIDAHAIFSAGALDPNPKEFHADHPFIFYIKVRDLIVFAGRIVSPL